MLALFLGLIVSAGLYFAYLWPQVEPLEEPAETALDSRPVDDASADEATDDA